MVAPAQLQEQGRTLSQAGGEEKALEKRFALRMKNQLFHQGNEHPGTRREGEGELFCHLSGLTLVSQDLRVPQGAAGTISALNLSLLLQSIPWQELQEGLPCPGQLLPGNDSGVSLLTWLTGKSGFFPRAHSYLRNVN